MKFTERLKNCYNKHASLLILIILFVLGVRNCQSCNKDQEIRFLQQEMEYRIDSLSHVIDSMRADSINDSIFSKTMIDSLRVRSSILEEAAKINADSNKELLKNNAKLVDANSKLVEDLKK